MKLPLSVHEIVLLALTALAGAASSLLSAMLQPAYAGRGALFGAALGLGIVLTTRLGRAHLDRGHLPPVRLALGMAVLAGIVAAGLLTWHAEAFPLRKGGDFVPPPYLSGLGLWGVSLVYSLLLHGGYAARKGARHPVLTVLLTAAVAGLAGGLLRSLLTTASKGHGARLDDVVTLAALSGLPFSLLWMLAAGIGDPGWSVRRWTRCGYAPVGIEPAHAGRINDRDVKPTGTR